MDSQGWTKISVGLVGVRRAEKTAWLRPRAHSTLDTKRWERHARKLRSPPSAVASAVICKSKRPKMQP